MLAKLVRDKHEIALFNYTKESNRVEGTVETAISWSIDCGAALDTKHFADVTVKWDGCSHFEFNGQDGDGCYYHICGISNYLLYIKVMAFIYEVMTKEIENYDEVKEFSEFKKLGILSDCIIEYIQ